VTWLVLVRVVGVIAGVLLVLFGLVWLLVGLSDPPSQNLSSFILLAGILLVLGALMAAPWSRIHSNLLWYVLFAALVLAGPAGALFILAMNTWSAIHGAGGPGFVLVGVVVIAWAIQLPAIWILRLSRQPPTSTEAR
jgi:hypothetical protein